MARSSHPVTRFDTVVGLKRGTDAPDFDLARDGLPLDLLQARYGPFATDVVDWLRRDVPVVTDPNQFLIDSAGVAEARTPNALEIAFEHDRSLMVNTAAQDALALLPERVCREVHIQNIILAGAVALVCPDLLNRSHREALHLPWNEEVTGWDGWPGSWQQLR